MSISFHNIGLGHIGSHINFWIHISIWIWSPLLIQKDKITNSQSKFNQGSGRPITMHLGIYKTFEKLGNRRCFDHEQLILWLRGMDRSNVNFWIQITTCIKFRQSILTHR